ncbi:hypothetical protein E2542_SST18726 [Spatholobus suberectus]|nr:hypothetical protein E2542_SST18726 [Spatholobus suberectus]
MDLLRAAPFHLLTLTSETERGGEGKAPTLLCCAAVGGNWRTQEAHEIVRRGKWCGGVNNKAG